MILSKKDRDTQPKRRYSAKNNVVMRMISTFMPILTTPLFYYRFYLHVLFHVYPVLIIAVTFELQNKEYQSISSKNYIYLEKHHKNKKLTTEGYVAFFFIILQ